MRGGWSVQPTRKTFFRKLPKDIVRYLKKPNLQDFTHHSFRRSFASALHNGGASKLTIKRGGAWCCDNLVEHYIATSHAEKRNVANVLDVVIFDPKKKPKNDDKNAYKSQEKTDKNLMEPSPSCSSTPAPKNNQASIGAAAKKLTLSRLCFP